jgi:hypothetical protein
MPGGTVRIPEGCFVYRDAPLGTGGWPRQWFNQKPFLVVVLRLAEATQYPALGPGYGQPTVHWKNKRGQSYYARLGDVHVMGPLELLAAVGGCP